MGSTSSAANSPSSYAIPTILGELRRHFRDKGWAVRPPRRLQELRADVAVATERLTHDLGRSPTQGDLSDALGVAPADVRNALAAGRAYSADSVDAACEGGPDGPALVYVLPDAEPGYDLVETRACLRGALDSLSERERRILGLRYYAQLTQSEIAAEPGYRRCTSPGCSDARSTHCASASRQPGERAPEPVHRPVVAPPAIRVASERCEPAGPPRALPDRSVSTRGRTVRVTACRSRGRRPAESQRPWTGVSSGSAGRTPDMYRSPPFQGTAVPRATPQDGGFSMSTASKVPQTSRMSAEDLSSDDARATLRRVGAGSLARGSIGRLRYGDGLTSARALGFQFVLSFIPLVIATVGLSATVQAEKPARALREALLTLSPGGNGDAVQQSLRSPAMQAGTGERLALTLGLVSAVVALVTSMGQLERSANRIYGIQRDRPSLRKYSRAAVLALAAGVPAMLGFVVLIAGGTVVDVFSSAYGWGPTLTEAWVSHTGHRGDTRPGGDHPDLQGGTPPPPTRPVVDGVRRGGGAGAVVTLHRAPRAVRPDVVELRKGLRATHGRRRTADLGAAHLPRTAPRPGLRGTARGGPRRLPVAGHRDDDLPGAAAAPQRRGTPPSPTDPRRWIRSRNRAGTATSTYASELGMWLRSQARPCAPPCARGVGAR